MKKTHNHVFLRVFFSAIAILLVINLLISITILLAYPKLYQAQINKQNQALTTELSNDISNHDSIEDVKLLVNGYEQHHDIHSAVFDQDNNYLLGSNELEQLGLTEANSDVENGSIVTTEYKQVVNRYLVAENAIQVGNKSYQLMTFTKILSKSDLIRPFIKIVPLLLGIVVVQSIIISIVFKRMTRRPIAEIASKANAITNLEFDNEFAWNSNDDYGRLSANLDQVQVKMKQVIEYLEDDSYLKNQVVVEEQKHQIAMLSHELNTPLTVLKMQNEILLNTDLSDNTRIYIERNLEKIDEITKIVSQILNHQIIDEDIEQISLNQYIMKLVENSYKQNNLNLIFEADPTIEVSPIYLTRIVTNMINNAIKYNYQNQVINLRITNTSVVVENKHSPNLRFDRDELLKPYVRGGIDNDSVGQGLGLYICQRISVLCGFSFDIESKAGSFYAKLKFDENGE